MAVLILCAAKNHGLQTSIVLKKYPDSWGLAMTLMEDDLLAALKELKAASLEMTSGRLPTGDAIERYNKAIEWSKRVISLAERSE
jgi:hypothetical protein